MNTNLRNGLRKFCLVMAALMFAFAVHSQDDGKATKQQKQAEKKKEADIKKQKKADDKARKRHIKIQTKTVQKRMKKNQKKSKKQTFSY